MQGTGQSLSTKGGGRCVRLGLVQTATSSNRLQNIEKALDGIGRAAAEGADIVCLQELFLSPYFCSVEDPVNFELAEPIPGPTTETIAQRARECGVVVVASLFEKRAPGLFHNTAVVLDANGALAGRYRKAHIPHDPFFYEKYYFTPGDTGYPAFSTQPARIAPLVCWDQWFPEAARLSTLAGAEIIVYPTAIGWLEDEKAAQGAAQKEAWELVQRSHAVTNGVFVAAVNRVGQEKEIEFWGGSFVSDPHGRVLARASEDAEEVLVVPCDMDLVTEARTAWPFLRDRRIDTYGDLASRFLGCQSAGSSDAGAGI